MSQLWTLTLLLLALPGVLARHRNRNGASRTTLAPNNLNWEEEEEFEERRFCLDVLPNKRYCASRYFALEKPGVRCSSRHLITKSHLADKFAVVSPSGSADVSYIVTHSAGPIIDDEGRDVYAFRIARTHGAQYDSRWFRVTFDSDCDKGHNDGVAEIELLANGPSERPLTDKQEEKLWQRYKGTKACPKAADENSFIEFKRHNNSYPTKEEDSRRKSIFIRKVYQFEAMDKKGYLAVIMDRSGLTELDDEMAANMMADFTPS